MPILKTVLLLMHFTFALDRCFANEDLIGLQAKDPVELDLKSFISKVLDKAESIEFREKENEKLLPRANKALSCSFSIAEWRKNDLDNLIISAKLVEEIHANRRDFKQLDELNKICQETKKNLKRKYPKVARNKIKLNEDSFPKGNFDQKIENLYINFLNRKKECTSMGADLVVGITFSIGPFIGSTVCKSAFGLKDISPTIGFIESSPGNSGPCIGVASGFSKIDSCSRSPTLRSKQHVIIGKDPTNNKTNRINAGFLVGESCYHLISSGKIRLGRDLDHVRRHLGFEY